MFAHLPTLQLTLLFRGHNMTLLGSSPSDFLLDVIAKQDGRRISFLPLKQPEILTGPPG